MKNKDMNIQEFRKYCENNDDNIVKEFDKTKFKLTCQKCKSEDVVIVNTLNSYTEYGCPTCGSWTVEEGAIVIKCCTCGSAIAIVDNDKEDL